MKKYISHILILVAVIGTLPPIMNISASPTNPNEPCQYTIPSTTPKNSPCASSFRAGTNVPVSATDYKLLQPLPCEKGTAGCSTGNFSSINPAGDPSGKNTALGFYLNIMIRILIGICAVLAMIMIVMGGIQYMTSELSHSKEEGKHRITNAVFGLILALGSYVLLAQINPDILNTDLSSLTTQTALVEDVGGESPDPFLAISQSKLQAIGIIGCTGSGGASSITTIGQQFVGKTSYSRAAGQRNTISGSTITLDCSAFVDQVFSCAGLPNPGGNTSAIFAGGNATSVKGSAYDYTSLTPGDLVGWPPSDDPNKTPTQGHVAIYMGNGQILDTTPSGTSVRPLSSIQSRVTFVKLATPSKGSGGSF